MKGMKLVLVAILATLPLALVACSSSSGEERAPGESYDFTTILESTVNEVIIPTYADLAKAAEALRAAANAFSEDRTSEQKMQAARDAWVAARIPWELSEAFLFGPVSDSGLDPAMDSWPVDHAQLDSILSSSITLSADHLASNLGGGLKGFHTIEYLLWGKNLNKQIKQAAEMTAREFDYLLAATEALAADTATLSQLWQEAEEEDGHSYGESVLLSGKDRLNGRFASQAAAAQQLITGFLTIADEVANGKIADPYSEKDPMLVESQFSHNSTADFADNIRGIGMVYTAKESGKGMARFVEEFDGELHARIVTQIAEAISAIEAISQDGETFRDAITNPAKNAAIEGAMQKIQALYTSFKQVNQLLVSG